MSLPEGDLRTWLGLADLVDHVGRPAVDVDVVLDHQRQRVPVEDVRGVHDLMHARLVHAAAVASPQGPVDLAGGDRVDERAGPPDLAVGETVILLHPPLPLAGASIWMERGCQ